MKINRMIVIVVTIRIRMTCVIYHIWTMPTRKKTININKKTEMKEDI